MNLPPAIQPILHALEARGYCAYLVGGGVRDSLMGLPVHDYDVATDALPEQVAQVFSGRRLVKTGLKHGTVTLITDSGPVEITTFRKEGRYSDHRHPDSVVFSTHIEEDLARRDFTVNAMALGRDGLLDLHHGRRDLEEKRIRCVGDPVLRFQEDPLRILRGLRLAACLDFSLEEETAAAMTAQAPLMEHLSRERISAELVRLLCGPAAGRVLLDFPRVVAVLIPELAPTMGFDQNTPYHCYDVYTHSVHILDHLPPDPVLRLAALLHDSGKPQTYTVDGHGQGHFPHHAELGAEIADRVLRRLRLDNATREQVTALIKIHGDAREMEERDVAKQLSRLGEALFFRLVAFDRGDHLAKAPMAALPDGHFEQLEQTARALLDAGACLSLAQLEVDGRDATAAGLSGPAVGEALHRLLDGVLEGDFPNKRDVLLQQLNTFASQTAAK